jgi:lauroyl/myristoyl acyltransferase
VNRAQEPRPAAASAPGETWRATGGGPSRGLRFLDRAFRLLPLRLAYVLVIGLAPIYFLHFNRARFAVVAAMRRMGRPHPWWAALRAYGAYVLLLVDRHYQRAGRLEITVDRGPGADHLAAAVEAPGPLVLLGSHCGALEMAAGAIETRGRLLRAVAVQDAGAGQLLEGVGDVAEGIGAAGRAIVADGSMRAGLKMLGALKRGEVLAFKSDRVLPGARPQDRLLVDVFGEPAELPRGPAEIVRLAGARAVIVHVFRVGPGRYRVVSRPVDTSSGDAAGIVASWVEGLEAQVRHQPQQWFNFYPYWPGDVERLGELHERVPPGLRVAVPSLIGALLAVAVMVCLLALGDHTMVGLRPVVRGALHVAGVAAVLGAIGFGLGGASVDRRGRRNALALWSTLGCSILAVAAAAWPGGLASVGGPVATCAGIGIVAGCLAALLPSWWTLRPDEPPAA